MDERWQELVEKNLDLARSLAWKYARRGLGRDDPAIDVDDLLSLAYEGLISAAKRFRPELGFRFSTYAVPAIAGSILKAFRRNHRGVHVSDRLDHSLRPAVCSLDIPVGRDGQSTLGDFAGATGMGEVEEAAITAVALGRLPEKLRLVVHLRCDGKTQSEIADLLCVSQAQVSRLEKRGVRALRAAVGE